MSGASSTSPQRASTKVRTKLNYNRISLACDNCRRRKIRCIYDKGKEPCQMCVKLGKTCVFTPRKESSESDDATGTITTPPDFQTPPSNPHSPLTAGSFAPGSIGASASQHVPFPITHDMSMYAPQSATTWHTLPPNIYDQYSQPTHIDPLHAPLPVRQVPQYHAPPHSQPGPAVQVTQSDLRPLAPTFTPYQNPLVNTEQGYMHVQQQWLPLDPNVNSVMHFNQQAMYNSMAPPGVPMVPSQTYGQVPVISHVSNFQPYMHQQAGLVPSQIRHDSFPTRWHNSHGDSQTGGEYYEHKER